MDSRMHDPGDGPEVTPAGMKRVDGVYQDGAQFFDAAGALVYEWPNIVHVFDGAAAKSARVAFVKYAEAEMLHIVWVPGDLGSDPPPEPKQATRPYDGISDAKFELRKLLDSYQALPASEEPHATAVALLRAFVSRGVEIRKACEVDIGESHHQQSERLRKMHDDG